MKSFKKIHYGYIKSVFAALKYNREEGSKGTPLRMRLFIFFMFFTIFIITAFILILMALGVSFKGTSKLKEHMENSLSFISSQIYEDFNTLSLQGVSMSKKLTSDIDSFLKNQSLSAADIKNHSEIIEPLLSEQMTYLINTLEYNKCSAVFILLDATVNPELENAEYSKAGIYINRTVPNAIGYTGAKFHYLRGPADIARENEIELLGQWKMEFNIKDEPYWDSVMDTAKKNSTLELSRLYYWTDRILLKGNSESGMLVCVPLISEKGDVYGVCGLQVSAMFFKVQYSPDNSRYAKIFSVLAPLKTDDPLTLDFNGSLVAGNSYLNEMSIDAAATINTLDNGLSTFNCDNGTQYGGLYSTIRLYPKNSPYAENSMAYCLIMPEEDLKSAMTGNSFYLYLFIAVLLLTSFLISLFISKKYISPVIDAFNNIKDKNYDAVNSRYYEINDLMEFLASRDKDTPEAEETVGQQENTSDASGSASSEASDPGFSSTTVSESVTASDNNSAPVNQHPVPYMIQNKSTLFEQFMKNIRTLSPAETAVFNLYLEGYTAQEITNLLCLSINTIKTHNRRIFAKLNVNNRNELMVYINMMKEQQNT